MNTKSCPPAHKNNPTEVVYRSQIIKLCQRETFTLKTDVISPGEMGASFLVSPLLLVQKSPVKSWS